jgi:flagellar basal body rod protein FlgG
VAEQTRYAALVGKRVEAYYRAGEVHMSAVGTLVTDSGKSICIEENFSQLGRNKLLRVDIPYDYIIRVVETNGDPSDSAAPK